LPVEPVGVLGVELVNKTTEVDGFGNVVLDQDGNPRFTETKSTVTSQYSRKYGPDLTALLPDLRDRDRRPELTATHGERISVFGPKTWAGARFGG
jgi:hypothetical protein